MTPPGPDAPAGPAAGTAAETPAGTASGSLAAFSVDVEDYFQVEALRSFCPRDKWDTFEDRTVQNTEGVLELLAAQGAKGTFFILGWTAQRHPDLVRTIATAGHEVASHGFDHELIYNQIPEAFRADIRKARSLLQDLSGQDVIGYRAPSYTIVARTQWALRILVEEGYRYDSSIFPIPRRRYGMPRANRWPHKIEVEGHGSIAEFPLPTIKVGPVNLPATGGAYMRLLPLPLQQAALKRFVATGRPFVLTLHPWELDPGQPRFPVGPRTRWTHYHNLVSTRDRLGALLSLSEYRPMGSVLADLGLL